MSAYISFSFVLGYFDIFINLRSTFGYKLLGALQTAELTRTTIRNKNFVENVKLDTIVDFA